MTRATRDGLLAPSSEARHEPFTAEGMRYRFQHLALPLVLKDMYFSEGDPGPGDRVPDFDLPLLGGGRFRSRDLAETGPALVMFGSGTCPVTDNAAPGLNALHRRFGARVRFVVVNVREAHPGKVEFEVAVDDIDGTLHRALSPKPNSAYVLAADGTILFRAQWANATEALAAALESVVAGEPSRRSQSGGLVRPMLRMLRNIAPALDRAGSGAWADMWLVAPPLAALALALKALHVRPAQGPLPATRPARAGAVPSQGR